MVAKAANGNAPQRQEEVSFLLYLPPPVQGHIIRLTQAPVTMLEILPVPSAVSSAYHKLILPIDIPAIFTVIVAPSLGLLRLLV